MRDAGLDVAALTDHATLSDNVLGDPLKQALLPTGYGSVAGISRADWQHTAALADAADTPGVFTAIRGFEWSEPVIGHVNVWFTKDFTDVVDVGDMGPLYDWLTRPTSPLLDGGQDGIAGFNHPVGSRAASRTSGTTPACATSWSASRCSTAAMTTSSRGTPTASPLRWWPASMPAGGPG